MKTRELMLSLLLLTSCTNKQDIILSEIEVKAETKIKFTEENIFYELPEYILVGITNHECFQDAPITERIFMMEAVWNRVVDNFNDHGFDLGKQLLAKKQFTGLFKYRPDDFSIDINNQKDRYLIKLAREIIYENKRIYPEKRIYYWAGTCDNDGTHGKWVQRNKLKTLIKTKNIFA